MGALGLGILLPKMRMQVLEVTYKTDCLVWKPDSICKTGASWLKKLAIWVRAIQFNFIQKPFMAFGMTPSPQVVSDAGADNQSHDPLGFGHSVLVTQGPWKSLAARLSCANF